MFTQSRKLRFISVLLVLLLMMTACSGGGASVPKKQPSETVGPVGTEAVTDTESSGETAAEAPELTPIRMRIEYEAIDITARYAEEGLSFDPTSSVFIGETLYVKSDAIPDGIQAHAYYYGFDAEGNLTESPFIVPLLRKSDAEIWTWHLLEDGRFVVGYEDTDKERWRKQRYLAIMEPDGTVTKSLHIGSLTDFQNLLVFEKTTQYGDHKVYIFAGRRDGYLRRCFDENLNERVCEITYDVVLYSVLDNDWFYAYSTPITRRRVHLATGEIKDAPLRVPAEYGYNTIIYGADGDLYLKDRNGIYHYQDDGRLDTVLNFMDSDCQYQTTDDKLFRIINPNTVFLLYRMSGSEGIMLYRMTRVPDDTQVQTIRATVISSADCGRQWLTDAISEFNRLYPQYYVKLEYVDPAYVEFNSVNEAVAHYLNEMLLYGDHPDILLNCIDTGITMVHYDKEIFLDLYTVLDQTLLNSVDNALAYQNKLYQVPMMMRLETFASSREICDGSLTYDTFFRALESVQEGQVLTDSIGRTLYENALMDFLDMNTKTAMYDSDGFRDVLRYLYPIRYTQTDLTDYRAGALSYGQAIMSDGWFGDFDKYWTRNGTIGSALASGDMKFLSVDFNTLDAYSIIRLLYGDTPFSLCGYPSMGVGGAYMQAYWSASVFYDTDVPEGCALLLNYLLSDEKQTDPLLLGEALPVTASGMSKAIELHRYTYFYNSTVRDISARNKPELIYLTPAGATMEYDPSYGTTKHTEDSYTVFEMTDDEARQLYNFMNNCSVHVSTDAVVESIIEEEASFWAGNARTLEETTKIIDSRVWIYLNE